MGDVVTTKFTGWDELQKKPAESSPGREAGTPRCLVRRSR